MSIARRRSMRAIAAFRKDYFADHPDATWNDAGLAYVMRAARQRIGVTNERAEVDPHDAADYAVFVETARASTEHVGEPPHGLKWPQARALRLRWGRLLS